MTEQIPFGRPLIGEQERTAAAEVLAGTTLTHGPRVKRFESAFAEFTGADAAVATATCMAALHLAYLAIELQPGEEVLVPAQTHVATAHAVEICGAKPVFVDADPRTGNLDLDAAESLVSERTRALSLVHYLGLPVDMERIMALAERHGLYVVEDCAVALGAACDGRHVGLHGDIGCFSFYPVKHITTGEGGMIVSRRGEIAERVSMQRAFGIDRNVVAERSRGGAYDVRHLGLNYRLGELGAAIGLVQLERLPGFLEQRRRNWLALRELLDGFEQLAPVESGGDDRLAASHYCFSALLRPPYADRRDQVMDALGKLGVGTSVYYPKSLPDTTYYRERYGYAPGSCPVATRISETSIAFPVGPHVSERDVERMAAALGSALDAG